jgi:Spy/CpxP family protein refolding chaperone
MDMRSSKGYALVFLLGAFVAGGAIGFTADRLMHAGGREGHGHDDFRTRMAQDLKLTPSQKTAIDSLMIERHRQIVALFKPVKPQLDSIGAEARAVSDSTHEQIKRLLNPSQQVEFDKMRDAARKDVERARKRWSAPVGNAQKSDSK